MSAVKVKVSEFSDVLKQEDQIREKKGSSLGDLVVFLSFDICDSTILKTKTDNKNWLEIIKLLFKTEFTQTMGMWKFNGDEIIYKIKVDSLYHISEIIMKAHIHIIKLKQLFEEVDKELHDDIYVKATIWIANVSKETSEAHNVELNYNIFEQEDYVGRNIDEGFRLTGCAKHNTVTIDPKIVYALLLGSVILNNPKFDDTKYKIPKCFVKSIKEFVSIVENSKNNKDLPEIDKKIYKNTLDTFNKCVSEIAWAGYRRNKGIWNNRLYPIFWYYINDLDNSENTDDNMLCVAYDDIFDNEGINGEAEKINDGNIEKHIDNLNKIFNHIKIRKEPVYKEVFEILENLHFDAVKKELYKPVVRRANLYYMVACINPLTKKVLIAKRSDSRKYLKNVWDFGNVMHKSVSDIKSTIEDEYNKTSGISIKVITDEDMGGNIKPIGFCAVHRGNLVHNGLLCCAEITSPENATDEQILGIIRSNLSKENDYTDVRFIDIDDIDNYEELLPESPQIITSPKSPQKNAGDDDRDVAIAYFRSFVKQVIAVSR